MSETFLFWSLAAHEFLITLKILILAKQKPQESGQTSVKLSTG